MKLLGVVALVAGVGMPSAEAFVKPTGRVAVRRSLPTLHAEKKLMTTYNAKESFAPSIPGVNGDHAMDFKSFAPAAAAFLAPLVLGANDAAAKGGELGILEGKTFALVHPTIMGALFLTTAYTGYLGWQFRTIRTLATDLNSLKNSLPSLSDGGKISLPLSKTISQVESALKALGEGAEADEKKAAALKTNLSTLKSSSVAAIDAQYTELSEKRKALMQGDFRERHYNTASTLLGLGVFTSILGGLNTYFRAGKLFPGPHLFAGAGITVLWAVAASLVPAMQKGNDTARTLHIAFNALNLSLFAWQVGTGLEIAISVWEKTKFP